jgi:hypothetical protein
MRTNSCESQIVGLLQWSYITFKIQEKKILMWKRKENIKTDVILGKSFRVRGDNLDSDWQSIMSSMQGTVVHVKESRQVWGQSESPGDLGSLRNGRSQVQWLSACGCSLRRLHGWVPCSSWDQNQGWEKLNELGERCSGSLVMDTFTCKHPWAGGGMARKEGYPVNVLEVSHPVAR